MHTTKSMAQMFLKLVQRYDLYIFAQSPQSMFYKILLHTNSFMSKIKFGSYVLSLKCEIRNCTRNNNAKCNSWSEWYFILAAILRCIIKKQGGVIASLLLITSLMIVSLRFSRKFRM